MCLQLFWAGVQRIYTVQQHYFSQTKSHERGKFSEKPLDYAGQVYLNYFIFISFAITSASSLLQDIARKIHFGKSFDFIYVSMPVLLCYLCYVKSNVLIAFTSLEEYFNILVR